jgi:hypothetical protein
MVNYMSPFLGVTSKGGLKVLAEDENGKATNEKEYCLSGSIFPFWYPMTTLKNCIYTYICIYMYTY